MIALDTNILVYAHRADAPFHSAAAQLVRALAEGRDRWIIPWPCAYEFLAIVTHPKIYRPPTPADLALAQLIPSLTITKKAPLVLRRGSKGLTTASAAARRMPCSFVRRSKASVRKILSRIWAWSISWVTRAVGINIETQGPGPLARRVSKSATEKASCL